MARLDAEQRDRELQGVLGAVIDLPDEEVAVADVLLPLGQRTAVACDSAFAFAYTAVLVTASWAVFPALLEE